MCLKLGQAHIAKTWSQLAGFDTGLLDNCPGDFKNQRLILIGAGYSELDLTARLAAHELYRFAQANPLYRLIIQPDNQISRLHSSLLCRRIVDGGNHLDESILRTHLYAQATEFTTGALLHLLEIIFIQIG